MGGCASRPKRFDDLPEEPHSSTKNHVPAPAQPEIAPAPSPAQESNDGGENQNEQPRVDHSESEPVAPDSSSSDESVDAAVPAAASAETANPTVDVVDVKPDHAASVDDKVEASDRDEVAKETEAEKSNAVPAPTKEEEEDRRSDEPLIKL